MEIGRLGRRLGVGVMCAIMHKRSPGMSGEKDAFRVTREPGPGLRDLRRRARLTQGE